MELANSCFLEKDRHQDRDLPGDRAKRIHLVGHGPDVEGYDLYTRADQRNAVIDHARPNDAFDDDVGGTVAGSPAPCNEKHRDTVSEFKPVKTDL